MRPLRPHPPGESVADDPPGRPLPPGAALWRATAPRPATPRPAAPRPAGDEPPAPVWRSARPPRRGAGPAAPAARPGTAQARPAPPPGTAPRTAPPARAPHPDAAETGPADPAPPGQDWEARAWQAPGGWQDPDGWDAAPWATASEPAAAGVPPARVALLTDLSGGSASDLRAFVRPPAQPGAAPEAPPPETPARRRGWRPRRASSGRDPAPSRTAYRLHRLWLTPMVRVVVRVGLPAWALAMGVGLLAADPDRRAWVTGQWEALRDGLAARPEFQIAGLTVSGASAPVEAALRAMAPRDWPVSSFGLDLEALRAEIETLDAVARADLRVGPDRRLAVRVQEREPAAVWRTGDGLVLVDAEGHRVARLLERAGRSDLPLLAGPGADRAVPEALALMAAAAPLRGDLLGLMRMGERRWDVVLTGDRRILLPETGAVAALERVLAQDQSQELLSRDIVHVDMRLPQRPTVRMTDAAVAELRRMRAPGGATLSTAGAGGAMR